MYGMNAANAYRKVGLETGVIAANPHQLIVMLFDGARTALANARRLLQQGDIPGKGKAISHAIAIIGGLRGALDMEAGGALAEQLAGLYDHMNQRLLLANLHNDDAQLQIVDGLLDTIGSAWRAIDPAAAATQAVAQGVPA